MFIFGLFIFFQGDQDGFDGPLLSNIDCQKVMAMFARGGLRQHRNWQKGVAGSYIGPDIPVPGLENGITSRVNERTEEGIFFLFCSHSLAYLVLCSVAMWWMACQRGYIISHILGHAGAGWHDLEYVLH